MEVIAKALHVCLVIYLFPSSCIFHQCYSFLHSNTHATNNPVICAPTKGSCSKCSMFANSVNVKTGKVNRGLEK